MADAHVFGRYRVTGTLGAGGMGEVFAAVDEVLGREVAVKTLRGKHSGLGARLLDERFKQEARAIAALAHPGVVQVFDIDLRAEPPYIVMERVTGPSLKERIALGALPETELRSLGIQIARALAAAHAAGIVHRDVKPANILAAAGGTWKLADFGVAHVPDSAITMTGQFVGSPAYAAPEALVRGECGTASDIYGLGAALYEAAAGTWPRAEATSGALLGPVPPLATLVQLSPEICAAIDRAVAVEPSARPTAAELADALAGATSQPGVATQHGIVARASSPVVIADATPIPGHASVSLPGIPNTAPWWQRPRTWMIAVGVVLLIGTIAALQRRSTAPSTTTNESTKPTPSDPPSPTEPTTIGPPAIATTDRRAGKDWRKVADKANRGEVEEAKKKLDEFEARWGESDETKALREQLDKLPDGQPSGLPHDKRGRGRDDN